MATQTTICAHCGHQATPTQTVAPADDGTPSCHLCSFPSNRPRPFLCRQGHRSPPIPGYARSTWRHCPTEGCQSVAIRKGA